MLGVTEGAGPAEVWQLRDYLDQAVRDAGGRPVPFTVLTDRARHLARVWFTLPQAPRHDFTPGDGPPGSGRSPAPPRMTRP